MERLLRNYVIELAIIALGAIAAGVQAIVVGDDNTAVLVGFTSFLLALAVASIRQEIQRQIGADRADRELIRSIPDSAWRRQAEAEFAEARSKFRSWAAGTRRVPEDQSLNFQIDELQGARSCVRALHVALDQDALRMWDNPQRGFARLVDAYKLLPGHVECRRIVVLDRDDDTISRVDRGERVIVDDVVEHVCREQMRPRKEGGLGADLRIAWVASEARAMANLLIIDQRQYFAIDSFGSGEFGDLEVCVDPALVDARVRTFEDMWTDATPAATCLRA